MKKIRIILFVLAVGIASYVFFNDYSSVSKFPEPSYTPFQDQQIVGFFDWSLIGPSGKDKNMLADQGNVMVLHFWDLTHPNAIEELTTFQKLYDDYKAKAQFYFVTKNSQRDVRQFIEQHQFSFPVFFSLSALPKPLDNDVIPSTYVLNKKGRIIVDSKISANWNSDGFRKVLDELVK